MKHTDIFPLGSQPLRIVEYTSGTGTFTPLVSNSWIELIMVGGGGGGGDGSDNSGGFGYGAGHGGGAGATMRLWLKVSSTTSYVVGAGGTAGSGVFQSGGNGSPTIFGSIFCPAGQGGNARGGGASPSGRGGLGGGLVELPPSIAIDGTYYNLVKNYTTLVGCTPGGCGGSSVTNNPFDQSSGISLSPAGPPGYPSPLTQQIMSSLGLSSLNQINGASGGSSLYGVGSPHTSGALVAPTGYGSGGGGGHTSFGTSSPGLAGRGGLIIIREYGSQL
jgi:hypothetical protein